MLLIIYNDVAFHRVILLKVWESGGLFVAIIEQNIQIGSNWRENTDSPARNIPVHNNKAKEQNTDGGRDYTFKKKLTLPIISIL